MHLFFYGEQASTVAGERVSRGKRKREKDSRRRVSNLFPWGPNPSVERRKQSGRGGEAAREGERRIYVFGEGQGNEGSDKCS